MNDLNFDGKYIDVKISFSFEIELPFVLKSSK